TPAIMSKMPYFVVLVAFLGARAIVVKMALGALGQRSPIRGENNDSILQAGNPIKEILLKLNLLDHRSILTDLKVNPTTRVLLWLFKDYSYSTLTQGYCEGQDMAPLPPRDQRHPWLWSVNRVHILDFAGLTEEMRQTLAVRLRMVYTRDDGQELFTSHAWRRLFEVRGPLVREFILEFFSTCRMSDIEMDLDAVDTLCFQLGGVRRRMT
ncbi:hypothetical protein Tco_1341345, partial [Tanacetum coccineum]